MSPEQQPSLEAWGTASKPPSNWKANLCVRHQKGGPPGRHRKRGPLVRYHTCSHGNRKTGCFTVTDIVTPEKRSDIMSHIRGKDTKPEIWLRKRLFAKGYRYRKNVNYVYGHPDLYLAQYKTAVFVNGCFWHQHAGCKHARLPKSNVEYWAVKFEKNAARDEKVKDELQSKKLRMLVIWECTITKMKRSEEYEEEMVARIEAFLHGEEDYLEL